LGNTALETGENIDTVGRPVLKAQHFPATTSCEPTVGADRVMGSSTLTSVCKM